MEELMQYVWGHRLFPAEGFYTSDGTRISIIDPGMLNTDAGPDFFNAKIRIGDKTWCGNIELHVRASDWFRHGHQNNALYDSVILHVVKFDDCPITRANGQTIPQITLDCAENFGILYRNFINTSAATFPCAAHLADFDRIHLRSWLDALAYERLNTKGERIAALLDRFSGSWEDTAYVTLARALGFGINSDAFERLALATPLRMLLKHSDSLTSIEAMLFGQAGLIPDNAEGYAATLETEYRFMAEKFTLRPLQSAGWKMSRMRPASFPQRRIALLAAIVSDGFRFMQQILETTNEIEAAKIFSAYELTGYWADNYTLEYRPAPPGTCPTFLSRSTINTLIINVVVPLQFAYGSITSQDEYTARAIDILFHIPPEQNQITRAFQSAGVKAPDALNSQALIQLKTNYCDTRKCLYCRIGHRVLSQKANGYNEKHR